MPSVTIGALTFIYTDTLLGLSQEITVSASVDFLDGQTLINAIRQAEESNVGRSFSKIADASGKNTLSAVSRVGITIELLDNWRIYTLKNSGTFTVGGANVVKSDGSTIFINSPGVTYNRDSAVASTQVSTSGTIAPTQQQIRDAQALALSAGATIAVTSIDSKLDNAGSDFVIL